MLFKSRQAALNEGKALHDFRGGIPAQNAFPKSGLTEIFDAVCKLFVVSIDLGVQRSGI
jgi:hypothetical protein